MNIFNKYIFLKRLKKNQQGYILERILVKNMLREYAFQILNNNKYLKRTSLYFDYIFQSTQQSDPYSEKI